MVRLKAIKKRQQIEANDYFNSNMVRLKVTQQTNQAGSLIKFQFQYGSIKSKKQETIHISQ